MQIKSNTSGKLKKMIDGTVFSSEFIFVRELFQNSQRAKAKNVIIKTKDDKIIFEDDGKGCKNPSCLFTLDYSDWESTDEGFGIGFWSCLALKNLTSVKVESYNWEAEIFVDNILNDNLNLDIIKKNEVMKGFKVTLNIRPLDFEQECQLDNDIVDVAQYLDLDTYYNGHYISKIDIFSSVEGDFVQDFKNKAFNGRISISNDSYSSIDVFYEKRFVCSIYNNGYIEGVIELKKGSVNLKEPDRRELIYDNKYSELRKILTRESKKLYIEFMKSNPSEDIMDSYSESIDYHLDVKDYEKYISYDSLINHMEYNPKKDEIKTCNEECNSEDIAITEDDNIDNSYFVDGEKVEDESSDEIRNSIKFSKDIYSVPNQSINQNDFYMDDYTIENNHSNNQSYDSICKLHDIEYKTEKKDIDGLSKFKKLVRKSNKMVWVERKDVDRYSDIIAQAEYAGLKIVKVDNILYANIFRKYNKMHISDFNNSFYAQYSFKNICIKNMKEERFLKLLNPICELFDLPLNTFAIANIEKNITLEYNDKVLYREKEVNKKGTIYTYACVHNGKIFLDRTALGLNRFNLSKNSSLNIYDLKAIMSCVNTISHELAHLLYGTQDNTINHYKTEVLIQEKITNQYIK